MTGLTPERLSRWCARCDSDIGWSADRPDWCSVCSARRMVPRTLVAHVEELTAERDELQRQTTGRKMQMHEYRQENEYMKGERNRLRSRINQLVAERDEHKERCRQFQEDWHAAEARVRELEAKAQETVRRATGGGPAWS